MPTLVRNSRSSGAPASQSTALSASVAIPASPAPGSLLIVNVLQYASGVVPTQPTIAGWNLGATTAGQASGGSSTAAGRLSTFWRVATGTETGSVTAATTGAGNTASWAATWEEFAGLDVNASPLQDGAGYVAPQFVASPSAKTAQVVERFGAYNAQAEDYATELHYGLDWVYTVEGLRFSAAPSTLSIARDADGSFTGYQAYGDAPKVGYTAPLAATNVIATGGATANGTSSTGAPLTDRSGPYIDTVGEIQAYYDEDSGDVVTYTGTLQFVLGNAIPFRALKVTAGPAFTAGVNTMTVLADASSSSDAQGIASYAWNWGDGTTTAAQASPLAQHTYANPGVYTITLTVTDTLGNVSTVSASYLATSRRVVA